MKDTWLDQVADHPEDNSAGAKRSRVFCAPCGWTANQMCPYAVSGHSREREQDFKAARNLFTNEAIWQRWQDDPPTL